MALVANQPAALGLDDRIDAPDVNDDLDELFRPMEVNIDRISAQTSAEPTTLAAGALKRSRLEADDLGLNEEIQITKKRKLIAKLDDERLLSQAGIPKLRRIVQERLKFRGKGHEFSDISRMLNLYQLWLDDLYPRAKFSDGLAMIEKLGHSKRMSVMRKEWIREKKTTPAEADAEGATSSANAASTLKNAGTTERGTETSTGRDASGEEESLFVGGDVDHDANLPDGLDEQPEDDELDALLAAESVQTSKPTRKAEATSTPAAPEKSGGAFEDQYAEEMMMMNDMEAW